ncbi:MAG: SUMF1/EgtB/PvdO family nonheme iron enzyme [Rhodocyclaceae bacterium]|nr:SUMF1/EgtB/PvdO family nonheme iron enzyme [Rhodocyclaceae bacterium]
MAPNPILSRILLVLAALCCLIGAARADDQKANRSALVIGNEDYIGAPPLSNAKADAQTVADILTDGQFGVVRGINTTSDELRKKWKNAFLPAIGPGDEAILYFSGQGVRVGDDSYLLPVDVRADNEDQVKAGGLSLKAVLEGVQQQKPRLFLVILDASRRTSAANPGLAAAQPAAGEVVIFSAAPGKTSLERLGDDDPRIRGLFSRVFLRELARPGVPLPTMLQTIQDKVSALAQGIGQEQVPTLFGQAPSDFRVRPAGAPDTGQRMAEEEERQIWEKTDAQRTEAAYKRFLKAFPDGAFAAKAKDRLDDLPAWELAKNGDPEPLRKYIGAHPDGLFVQKARALLDEGDLWEKARAGSVLALVKDYLDRYPQGRFIEPAKTLFARLDAEAAAKREEDAWKAAQNGATTTSFEQYLKTYPDGRFAASAKETIEKIVWETAQKGNSSAALENYLKLYPQGRFASSAKDNIEQIVWDKAQKGNNEASFQEYLRAYPQGRFADTAKDTIEQIAWDKAQKGNSEAAFDAYLKVYPQGRFAASARDKTEQLVWDNVQRSRTIDLAHLYLQRYPQGKFSTQARNLEEDILWDEARQCDANDQSGDPFRCDSLADAFIRRFSAGQHATAATILQHSLVASRPEREERKALSDALATGEPAALQAFLDKFPTSKHYADAMMKLAALWQKIAPIPVTGVPFYDAFTDGSGKSPEMVALPSGKFAMGSEEAQTEKPSHPVVIVHPFAIGRHEVTFDDWDACVADKGGCSYRPDDEVGMLIFRWKGRGKQPVINVAWADIQQYLVWLRAKTGKKYRLLTEAEWEYAARAGTTTRYNFGDNADTLVRHGWYTGNSERQPHLVGQLEASPNGLYDMYGNVAEWVEDCWHSSYDGAPRNGNVAWTANCVGAAHVSRGGYFYDTASNQRSASRSRVGNTMRSPSVGFRLARDYP